MYQRTAIVPAWRCDTTRADRPSHRAIRLDIVGSRAKGGLGIFGVGPRLKEHKSTSSTLRSREEVRTGGGSDKLSQDKLKLGLIKWTMHVLGIATVHGIVLVIRVFTYVLRCLREYS